MAFRLIIFDLDGTLIDTIRDLGAAVDHTLSLRGLGGHSIQDYKSMVGHGVRELVRKALPRDLSSDDATIDECLSDFKSFYTNNIDRYTRPYAGIPELLSELQESGVHLAVASNKFQAGTEYLVKRFFPAIHFDAILGNRNGFPLKPSPEIVGEALRASGVGREDTVLVGDSPTDMRTAAAGGIKAIAVGWGYRDASDLLSTGASLPAGTLHSLVTSVPDLRRLLLD